MDVTEIVMIVVGIFTVLGSIVSVVWVISNRPTYEHCDDTYQRKDLHSQEYNRLLEKIEELRKVIMEMKGSSE